MTTTIEKAIAKFEEGKTYFNIWNQEDGRPHMRHYTIVKRTPKTIVLKSGYRCRIFTSENGVEGAKVSYGTYIYASDLCTVEAENRQIEADKAWDEIDAKANQRMLEIKAAEAEREEILSTPLVSEEAFDEAYYGEVTNAHNAEIAPKKEAFRKALIEALLLKFTLAELEEVMLEYAVTPEAMEIAINSEIEAANVATGYVFSKIFADGEVINTSCKIIGDENNFDNSVYREVVFFDPERFASWELKTADGKLLAKGNSKNDAYKFLATETDGSEDDTDDQNDVFKYLPAIESLNDVDTNQTKDEMKAAADQMGLMQLNRKIADLEEQLIDNRLAATAVLNKITDDTTFAEQKEIERRYFEHAAISDALIDEKAIYKAAKFTRLSQIAAIKNLMRKNQNTSSTKEPPALDIDDKEFFNTQAAFIDATIQRNLAERDLHTAKDKFAAAENVQFDAKQKLQNAANKIVKQLDNIVVNVFIPAKKTMTLITQDDNEQIKTDFSQFTITYYEGFRLANHHDYCATYDTPAEIRTVIDMLQAAIARGDEEFTFPTVDELNTPPEMPPCAPKSPDITAEDNLPINDEIPPKNAYDAQIAQINKTAPVNWSVSFDTDKNNFPVKFQDKTITTLDSLALAKVLPPEKFFEQFRPLVDKNYSPKQQFQDDRRKELAALQDMRKLITDDAERLKSIDDMIDAIKRELLEISLE